MRPRYDACCAAPATTNHCRFPRTNRSDPSPEPMRGCVDALTAFGLFAVTAMLVCYALEARSPWWTLGFAAACLLGSAYGFLQGAWPFGMVEAVWAIVAV